MKSTTWRAPLVVQRFKTPTGPLADCDPGMVYDFSKQRHIMPATVGNRDHLTHGMNVSGEAADAHLTSLDTNGVPLDQFPFPK